MDSSLSPLELAYERLRLLFDRLARALRVTSASILPFGSVITALLGWSLIGSYGERR